MIPTCAGLFPRALQISQHFRDHGYDIIDVLTDSDVHMGVALFKRWHFLNHPQDCPHGVQKYYQCGHSAFAWFTRTRPRVQEVFATIWCTSELVVSFDGYGYWPKSESRRNPTWMHVDQSLQNLDFACVQGLVTYTDNPTCGFYCLPRSHVAHHIGALGTSSTDNWVKLDPEIIARASKLIRREPELIYLKKGQMLIWDSRLVHQNMYGPEERLVQYVSFLPKSGLNKTQSAKRGVYFKDRRTTSHRAYPVRVNSLQPQTYGDDSKLIDYSKVVESKKGQEWLDENQGAIKSLVA